MTIPPEVADRFLERFPRYTLLLPTWNLSKEIQSPLDEAWCENLPLKHAEVLYLYGIGDGRAALLLRSWLQEHPSHHLVFLEPNGSQIVQFLCQPFALEVLDCQQVEIYYLPRFHEKTALIQELADRYPVRGVFVEPIPGLKAVDLRSMRRTRLSILRKTALSHGVFVDRFLHHIPLSHLLKNAHHLSGSFYANRMKDAFHDIPAIICGAGPSLQKSIETLRHLENRALIIAGGSAIAALSAQGIVPHFTMAIDPNPDEFQRLANSFAFDVPLIFSSRLFPDCLATLNGPFGYLRSGMAGLHELWMDEQLGLTEPILGEHLSSESLSVTTLAAALSEHLGCNPILFDGLDLAYTQNCRYADGVSSTQESPDEHLQPIDRRLMKKDCRGKPVLSAVRWIMEAKALSHFVKHHRQRCWINCTQGGMGFEGIEMHPLSEIEFSREWDLRGQIQSTIQRCAMPLTTAQLPQKIDELKKSLDVVLEHLQILVNHESEGKCALAEIELKEELASAILFFDAERIIPLIVHTQEKGPLYWKAFLEMALKCRQSFEHTIPSIR